MANNVGLGFIFGAVTKGMTAGLKVVGSGVRSVGEGLSKIGEMASKNPLGTMIDALNLHVLTDIKDQIGQIAGMNTDTSKLTSTFESFGVQVDEAFSSVAAGLNMSGKEARKWEGIVSSAAMGTNTSIDGAVGAFKALQQQHIDLKKIGIPTFSEYLKLMKVAGLDSGKFTTTLGQLKGEFGLSDDQLKGLLDDFASISKKGNLGADAIGAMSDQVETLRPILLATLKTKGPAAVATMLRSTQELAAVMQATYGGDPQANLQASLALTEKLANSQLDMSKAFIGLGEYPEMYQMLATNVGSVAEAEKLAKSDAVGFVKELRRVNQQMASKDPQMAATFMERMAVQLAETSPALADVFKGGKAVDEAFKTIATASGPAAAGALEKVTKAGFRTGRTLSDNVQLALDGFTQKIRNIDGKAISRLFYKDVIPAIGDFGTELQRLSKDKGPLGLAIRKLSDFQMVGMAAFLPLDTVWGKKVFVFGKMMAPLGEMIAPFLMGAAQLATILPALFGVIASVGGTALTALGATLEFLVTPIGAVVAGIAALLGVFALGTDLGGQFTEKVVGALNSVIPKIAGWVDLAASKVSELADYLATPGTVGAIGDSLVTMFKLGLERLGAILETGGPLMSALGGLAQALGKLYVTVFKLAWGFVGDKIGELWASMSGSMQEGMASYWSFDPTALIGSLKGMVWDAVKQFSAWWNGVNLLDPEMFNDALGSMLDVRAFEMDLLDWLIDAVQGFDVNAVVEQFDTKMMTIMGAWTSGASGGGSDYASMWTDWVGSMFEHAANFLENVDWGQVASAMWSNATLSFTLTWKLLELVTSLWWKVEQALPGIMWTLMKFGGEALLAATQFVFKAWLGIVEWEIDLVIGQFGKLWDYLVSLFGHSVNTLIGDDFAKIPGVVQPALDWLTGAFEGVFSWVKSLAETTTSVLTGMVSGVVSVGQTVLSGIVSGITAAVQKLKDGLGFMKEIVSSIGLKLGVRIDTAADTADAAKTAGRQEMMAQNGKDSMEILIGVVKIGLDTLHADLLILQRQGAPGATPARPAAKGGPSTALLSVGAGGHE